MKKIIDKAAVLKFLKSKIHSVGINPSKGLCSIRNEDDDELELYTKDDIIDAADKSELEDSILDSIKSGDFKINGTEISIGICLSNPKNRGKHPNDPSNYDDYEGTIDFEIRDLFTESLSRARTILNNIEESLSEVSIYPPGYTDSIVAEANDKYFLLSLKVTKNGTVSGSDKDIKVFISKYNNSEDGGTKIIVKKL